MEAIAEAIGLSVSVTRFLACYVSTIPVSLAWNLVPRNPALRHAYSAFTGILLSCLAFGFSSQLLFVFPISVGYLSMLVCRKHCGRITFFLAFCYLIFCHVYYMSGDAWKEGGIDATGALMVLTLKVISCAINCQDGLLEDSNLHEAQKKYRLLHCPSFMEFLGYCLCCGTHFAGPVFEMKDYLDWTENKGVWAPSNGTTSPSPIGGMLRSIVQAIICMGVYFYLVPRFPLSRFKEPIYQEWALWKKIWYQYMNGFTARWKYYFIWSISEASVIASGLGFSGWSDSKPPKPKWDRARNVDIIGVEFAKSTAELPLVWNIQVSTWLRHYVYERLIKEGKKPGFMQLLATQTISAVWHGLYAGYILFFLNSALFIAGSKVLYKWQQAVPKKFTLGRKIITFVNMVYTALSLNCSCIGFLVLSLHETLAAYRSVYFIGTLSSIALIILGIVVKPKPGKERSKKTR